MFFINLETERIFLKNVGKEDRNFIYNLFSPGNDDVNKFHPDDAPYKNISEADEEIKYYITPEPRNLHQWVIIRKTDKEKMGLCCFHDWDRINGKVDIHFDLNKEFWKNGYMQESLKKIIEFAINEMNIFEINACIDVENINAIILVKKLGFVENGYTNGIYKNGKEFIDCNYTLFIKIN
jgi:ribosomal-protein-alanine N-acetyltransferase